MKFFKYYAYSGNSFLLWSWVVLLNMDYTGRLRPKGVPHSDWRYIKGYGFNELKYRKGLGKLSFRYEKGLSKYLEQILLTADSPKNFKGYSSEKFSKSSSRRHMKGVPFPVNVCERGTFSIKNGIYIKR